MNQTAKTFAPVRTSCRRHYRALWERAGGRVEWINCTGEERYRHPLQPHPLRANGRRKDVSAKMISMLNAVLRLQAACGTSAVAA
jgi:hypothetical protein